MHFCQGIAIWCFQGASYMTKQSLLSESRGGVGECLWGSTLETSKSSRRLLQCCLLAPVGGGEEEAGIWECNHMCSVNCQTHLFQILYPPLGWCIQKHLQIYRVQEKKGSSLSKKMRDYGKWRQIGSMSWGQRQEREFCKNDVICA